MLKSFTEVMDDLKEYASPKSKLTRMIAGGQILRIARGVYGTEETGNPRYPVAYMLDGESYISFSTALGYYRMLKADGSVVESATARHRKRRFSTPLGTYEFLSVPEEVYAEDVSGAWEQGRPFRMATREKALCDLLYQRHGIKSQQKLEELLFGKLGIDRQKLEYLDWVRIGELAGRYPSSTLKTLMRWRESGRRRTWRGTGDSGNGRRRRWKDGN